MSSLPIGTYESKLLAVHKLSSNTYSNVGGETHVQEYEQELLLGLLKEDPIAASTSFTESNSSNISTEVNNHLMIHNSSNDSNIAMKYEFTSNTDVTYTNSEYFEKQDINSVYTNKVELGNDTAPLYNGNLKIEYFDGSSNSITDEHILQFNTTDSNYNLHKAMNSTLSNTNSSATNGFIVDFNNGFNASKAFFTEDILQRDANDNSISSIGDLGEEGITTSKPGSVAGNLNWEKFDATIVENSLDPPMFGALKFVRDLNPITMSLEGRENNVVESSTLSKLIHGYTETTIPDLSFDSTSFSNLFTPSILEKIAPGFSFEISINTGEGGYSLKEDTANVLVPQYNDSNIIDTPIFFTMATIDDTEITENAVYMNKMKEQSLFDNSSHKLNITNGDLVKTSDTNPNPNFECFNVLDGVESLTGDLDNPGKISFVVSNNTLGDSNARYTKYSDPNFTTLDTTVTAANSLEVDYDTLIDEFKTNYDVTSTLSVLSKSTGGSDSTYWASDGVNGNVAKHNDVSLVFQETPNSTLFSSTNISNFTSSIFDPQNITLLSLTKKLAFENESALFKTNNNEVVSNVVSSVNIASIDLNSLGADDIRITILPKVSSDIPAPGSWIWVTGNSLDGSIASDFSPQNNNKLFSQINNNDYSAMQFYNNIHTMQPTDVLNVTFMLKTNESDMASKELLTTHPFMQIVSNGSTTELPLESKDYVTNTPTVSVSSGLVQSLSNATGVSPGYVVTKYITTKTYTAAIRAKLGAYKNLWIVTEPVTEVTEWYQLTNSLKNNQIMPDYYLINIKDSNGYQLFKASRSFTVNSTSVKSISSGAISLNVKDLMGFNVSAQYSIHVDGNTTWNEFTLKPDSNFNNSLDLFYEYQSTITLVDSNGGDLANVNIAVDAATGVGLGADADGSYMISLSIPSGTNSFDVVGYEYSQSDLQYLNKSVNWSPYAVGDALFLKNGTVNVGTKISNLSTNVVLSGASDPSQENSVTVTVTKDDNVLFSFVSNKYILENFNIISMPKVIVQHDYRIGTSTGTEYLLVDHTTNKVGLPFGNTEIVSGISALITYGYLERVNTSYFKLNGDKVLITPLEISTVPGEQYAGRYAVAEEIKPSITGYPLPTNSLLHRNIAPTVFRGLVEADPIILTRTATTAKFTIGSNIEDNFDGAVVTKDKTFTVTQMMEDGSTNIGELGLKFTTSFSMLPKTEGGDYIIDVLLNADTYTKTILNPNDTSIETTVTSNLFDFVLHEFKLHSIVATRIKVYDQETYVFSRGEPLIRVYHNSNYIGDPRVNNQWSLLTTPINETLLNNEGVTYGVVNFKKIISLSSGFTKYCILPRPTATLSAYSITDLTGSLPYDINATRKTHHFDIKLSETNKPFTGKAGLNDVSLSFPSSTQYLSFRTPTAQLSFDIGSNKLKISSSTGLTANTNNTYTTIFDGYISELATTNKWESSFSKDSVLNATNTFSGKKWNLKIPQLKTPIVNLLIIPDTRLEDQCIHIDGITSFGMNGPYTLDLKILDSVKMVLYKVDLQYNSVNDTEKAVFYKYSSVEGIPWTDKNELTKSIYFNPILVKRETCELPINITNNTLTSEAYNIGELIKNAITTNSFSGMLWTLDNTFTEQNSPVSFTTLSIKGAQILLRIIGVTKATPVNILRSKRPYILDIRRADGSRSMGINHDGQLVTHKLITKRIDMEQTTVGGYVPSEHSPVNLNGIYNQNNISGSESDI